MDTDSEIQRLRYLLREWWDAWCAGRQPSEALLSETMGTVGEEQDDG